MERDGLRRVAEFCQAGVARTGAQAMAVLFATSSRTMEVLYATDDLAERAAQMEFVLGEGPVLEAVGSSVAVTADDMHDAVVGHRWPLYAAEATRIGVLAVHVFPLRFSDGALGAVAFYARNPSRLSTEQQRLARDLTELIGLALVDPESGVGATLGVRMTVHQAGGMVMQQADLSIEDALVLLKLTAFTEDVPVTDLAIDVIGGRRRFGKAEVADE